MVDFVMASYLAPFLPFADERPWGVLVGGPSSGKTQLLNALQEHPRSVEMDDVTTNALTSGYVDKEDPGKDHSLFARLRRTYEPTGPKVLFISDMSTIFNMGGDKCEKTFALLRRAYDGKVTTATGSAGLMKRDDLCFGMLMASTPEIDRQRKKSQSLGERSLLCRLRKEDFERDRALGRRVAAGDRHDVHDLAKKIEVVTHRAIDAAIVAMEKHKGNIRVSKAVLDRLGDLGAVAVRVRECANDDPEKPPRLVKQLRNWGDARALFDGRDYWNDSDYDMIRRIVQDTMPPENLRAIKVLYDVGTCAATLVYEKALVESSFCKQLDLWCRLDILKNAGGIYSLVPVFRECIESTGFLDGL